ncbi:MAG: hypothetical protein PHR06_12330 [Candidatus Cloacimonetes bacterium]|nr:hypothetical protein [Candidatus Cloacimonadota bacterium]
MKRITILLLTVMILSLLTATDWNNEEASHLSFEELDDQIALSFRDAVDANPISNISVKILDTIFETDVRGMIKFPIEMIEYMDDEDIAFVASKKGYITLNGVMKVRSGSVYFKDFVMSREIPLEKVRFVLQWDKKPNDLDLHLRSENFHISYRNMRNIPNKAILDRDDLDGYGPETITLDRIEEEEYKLYVHNYSNETKINSKAILYVYAENSLVKTICLPETKKRFIRVLRIVGKEIFYENTELDRIE